MGLLHKDLIGSFFQGFYVLVRESSIASFDKIMVESCVGVPWRTDSDNGEVKVVDGVGGDRGGDGVLLPLLVRFAYQSTSPEETKTDDYKPKELGGPGLNRKACIEELKILTQPNYLFVDMYARPCTVEVSRNSLRISMAIGPSSNQDFRDYPNLNRNMLEGEPLRKYWSIG